MMRFFLEKRPLIFFACASLMCISASPEKTSQETQADPVIKTTPQPAPSLVPEKKQPAVKDRKKNTLAIKEVPQSPSSDLQKIKGPPCKALYVYLYDLHSETVLFEKNAHQKMAPSSMTKIMTVYYLFRELKDGNLDWNDLIFVSPYASKRPGSRMFLKPGEHVKVIDLLKGIVVSSGNDACCAIAEAVAGSEEGFGQVLTQMAKELGMPTSHFMNGSGLPHKDHVSSAYDLYVVSRKTIEDFPELYKDFYALKNFSFNKITQPNRNILLKDDGVDGFKTGMTQAGGFGMVVSKVQGDRRLILVINGLQTAQERAAEARRILSWGFQNFVTLVLKKEKKLTSIQLWNEEKSVDLFLEKDLKLCIPKTLMRKVTFKIQVYKPVAPPLMKGQRLGALIVEIPDHESLKIPLVIHDEIEKKSIFIRFWKALTG